MKVYPISWPHHQFFRTSIIDDEFRQASILLVIFSNRSHWPEFYYIFSSFYSAVCFLQPVIRLGLLLIRKKYRFIFRVYLSEVCLGKRTVVESNCKKKIKCHFIKRNLKKTKVWKQKKLIRSEKLQSFAEVFDFPFSGKNKNWKIRIRVR